MTTDDGKTRQQLTEELERLRRRVADLERESAARMQAEEALFTSEARYRRITEALTDYIYTVRLKGGRPVETLHSPACVAVTGYTVEEFATDPYLWFHMVHEQDRSGAQEQIAGLLAGQSTAPFEHRIVRKDGEVRWVRNTPIPHRDSQGNLTSYEGLVQDITERKRAEESLRESEERYRSFVESFLGIAFRGRMDFVPLFFHGAIEAITGYKEQDFLAGKPRWDQVIHPEDLANMRQSLEDIRLLPHYKTEREYRIIRKDGQIRWVREFIQNVCDESGKPIAVQGAIHDITERVRLQERLREAEKMEAVGRLAGGVAHKFNNLLTVVNGYSEMLLGTLDAGQPMRQDVKAIRKAGLRAAELTQQLLAFSRRQVLRMRVLDLDTLLQDMVPRLGIILGKEITLRMALDGDLGEVRADSSQVEEVVVSLATNARGAMPDGGVFALETSNITLDETYAAAHLALEPGRYVLLAVSDTGVGTSPEVQEHIFEPFFTTKGLAESNGLGLGTVYGIIRQLGGDVHVYSEPGLGTTFKIYLPQIEEAPAAEAVAVRPTAYPGGRETILVVEGDAGVRRLASHILRSLGYRALAAANGAEALELCRAQEEPVDLLLIDVMVSDMSCRQLVERLEEIQDIRVVYMSGYPEEVIDRPGARWVAKPFDLDQLATRLRQALDE